VQGLDFYHEVNQLSRHHTTLRIARETKTQISKSNTVIDALAVAWDGVLFDLNRRTRATYVQNKPTGMDLGHADIRHDSPAMRAERCNILSLLSIPVAIEQFEERAKWLDAFLGEITAGQTIMIAPYDDNCSHTDGQLARARHGNRLFATLGPRTNDNTLRIRYDSFDSPEVALRVPLASMFNEPMVQIAHPDIERVNQMQLPCQSAA
jgi:hypothetical protein